MEYIVIIAVCLGLFLFFVLKEVNDSKKRFQKAVSLALDKFGKKNEKPLGPDELEDAKAIFYRYQKETSIDDITASDIEIDKIFETFNVANSEPGREYFYHALRNPVMDEEKLKALDKKAEYISKDEESRKTIVKMMLGIGFLKKTNFFKCLDYFDDIENTSLIKEYAVIVLFFSSIVLTCISPQYFVMLLIAVLIYNIFTYYSKRGQIEPYILCLKFITNFIAQAGELKKLKLQGFETEIEECKSLLSKLSGLTGNTNMLGAGGSTGAGNPLELIADYLRMFLHLDIIKFYKMLGALKSNKNEVEQLYLLLGELEYPYIVASMRKALGTYCVPEKGSDIVAENIYHPLIKNPVKSSFKADRGILITGSNASGKSTFLKTVALNSIFAKTVYTCTADAFICDDYSVFSSMSLRDDLLNEDSYFMVEIKALKRILDFAKANPDKKVLCFVDEVLRGTNTIERIAACTKILESIAKDGIVCFGATHDYELTETLAGFYDNYHFDEEIRENDIVFNYELKKGRATSRNAIKLLSIMGFSEEIVENARKMANTFMEKNVWINE